MQTQPLIEERVPPDLYSKLAQPCPLLVIISGPSGVGKDAVIERMKELHYPFHFVVTATTRPPRANEVDGVDYHFISMESFTEMLRRDELLEHALVYGQYKGIPKAQVRQALASGKDVILRIDVQGSATVRSLFPDVTTIFLTAESEEELISRLRQRQTENENELNTRIDTARLEMQHLPDFDYVVVNRARQLDSTVNQVAAIITAEKCRVSRRMRNP